ncbi:hypothetical protein B1A87_017140 [Arthrobacter sp. KBS0703]|uniref:hypothetical protein n=1 Tax=Arthrobacter sp. KBS0703 TaxID=1955698 RepID=UPI0011847E8B|nr:hypothetical protein [Arthrobacter sp. KBS0703]TSE17263.1 hypothetical protein B1A87_017140 [Arthrobacter sp. KBS0703]
MLPAICLIPVSYTHLDVYKRQRPWPDPAGVRQPPARHSSARRQARRARKRRRARTLSLIHI